LGENSPTLLFFGLVEKFQPGSGEEFCINIRLIFSRQGLMINERFSLKLRLKFLDQGLIEIFQAGFDVQNAIKVCREI